MWKLRAKKLKMEKIIRVTVDIVLVVSMLVIAYSALHISYCMDVTTTVCK